MGIERKPAKNGDSYRWERGKRVPRAVVRRFVRQVVDLFQPNKVVLFGSYAYGEIHADSDVDILVVMPAPDELTQAVRILDKTDHPFPLDLIVRTPENLQWRLEEGDWFLREVMAKGKVLHEEADGAVGAQGGKRSRRRKKPVQAPTTLP